VIGMEGCSGASVADGWWTWCAMPLLLGLGQWIESACAAGGSRPSSNARVDALRVGRMAGCVEDVRMLMPRAASRTVARTRRRLDGRGDKHPVA
jgi:hypothetical protein